MIVFPTIGDWGQYVADRVPSYLGGQPQWAVVQLLAEPLSLLDASVASMAMGLDLPSAVGAQIDQIGSWVDERRASLGDDEYRRIVMGREAAAVSDGGIEALWPLWLALTGAAAGSARIVVYPWTGFPLAYFEAQLLTEPTGAWVRRAGAVLRDSVAFPIDVLGVVSRSDGMVWDASDGWDIGTWGAALPYEVP